MEKSRQRFEKRNFHYKITLMTIFWLLWYFWRFYYIFKSIWNQKPIILLVCDGLKKRFRELIITFICCFWQKKSQFLWLGDKFFDFLHIPVPIPLITQKWTSKSPLRIIVWQKFSDQIWWFSFQINPKFFKGLVDPNLSWLGLFQYL